MDASPQGPPQVGIPVGGIGDVEGVGSLSIVPPTFLEMWGVVFVSVGGAWMLIVAACMIFYYLHHMFMPPPQTGTAADYKAILELNKTAADQFRDSLSYIFDLMVTKTILPLVTLLLGYLFGSKKS